MDRHFVPFWGRQKIADMVRRRSRGGVLPFGRTASITGSQIDHASSENTDCIMLIIKSYAVPVTIQDLTGPSRDQKLSFGRWSVSNAVA